MTRTRVGYTGGSTSSPSYHDLADHTEALQVDFDPSVLSFEALIEGIWEQHNPTQKTWGTQYMAAVWTNSDEQHDVAVRTGERAARRRGGKLETRIEPLREFWRAEDYHQKYRLRRMSTVVDELVRRFGSDRGMVDSTEAARLNGLLSGHGDWIDLDEWLPSIELSDRAAREVRSSVR